jgi:hypothetical protein
LELLWVELFVFVEFYLVSNYNMDKTKKILMQKAKTEYYRGFLRLDIDEKELQECIKEIKNTTSKTKLDKITFNLFHY